MNARSALVFSPGAAGPVLGAVPDWRDLAACAGEDPDLFYPEPGGSVKPAKQICAGCPVRAECLEDALKTGDRFGVRGGLSERERGRLHRQRKPAPSRYCTKRLHERTPENTYADGRCGPCARDGAARKAAEKRVLLTGSSSPRSGVRAAKAA